MSLSEMLDKPVSPLQPKGAAGTAAKIVEAADSVTVVESKGRDIRRPPLKCPVFTRPVFISLLYKFLKKTFTGGGGKN